MNKEPQSAEEILKRYVNRDSKGYNYDNIISTEGTLCDFLRLSLSAMEEFKNQCIEEYKKQLKNES